jgi:tetratricopeptide (TPR) repeat protein
MRTRCYLFYIIKLLLFSPFFQGHEKMRRSSLLLFLFGSLFAGPNAAESDSVSSDGLKFCISYYRDGYYNRAIQCIEEVLPALTTRYDSLESYKMLALSYGMINRIEKAKECFSLAFEKDSVIEIDTLAFPPNIALIFNQVKLEKKMSGIVATPPSRPVVASRKKSSAVPALFLSSVVLSAGGAGYFYYKGYLARKEYSSLKGDAPKAEFDRTWTDFRNSIAAGIGSTVISGVATWLFFQFIEPPAAVSVVARENAIGLAFSF